MVERDGVEECGRLSVVCTLPWPIVRNVCVPTVVFCDEMSF